MTASPPLDEMKDGYEPAGSKPLAGMRETVTEEMVEAGAKALNQSVCVETFDTHYPWCGTARAVIEAALALQPDAGLVGELVEAIKALRTMRDAGPKPQKLDEALTWRANDELAESMAINALARAEALKGER